MQYGTLDDVNALEDYAGRIQAIVWEVAEWVPAQRLEQAQRLANAGENGEAMVQVAWAIVVEQVHVPRELIARIQEHAEGLIEATDMPSNLDEFAR